LVIYFIQISIIHTRRYGVTAITGEEKKDKNR